MSAYAKNEKNKVLWVFVPAVLLLLFVTVTADIPTWFRFLLSLSMVGCLFLGTLEISRIEKENGLDMSRAAAWRSKFDVLSKQILPGQVSALVSSNWQAYLVRRDGDRTYIEVRNGEYGSFITLLILHGFSYVEYLSERFDRVRPEDGTHSWKAWQQIFQRCSEHVGQEPINAIHHIEFARSMRDIPSISYYGVPFGDGVERVEKIVVDGKPFLIIPTILIDGAIEIMKK